MSEPKEHLVAWLRDAHAMEMKAVELLEKQCERIENYPEMEERLSAHLQETRWQAEQLEKCLKRLDSDTSAVKSGLGKLTGNLTAMGSMFAPDEIVKDTMASSVFEHFEITSYKILIAAAEHAGEPEIAQTCREILAQEEAMADWLEDHIPSTTAAFLSRDMIGAEAKI